MKCREPALEVAAGSGSCSRLYRQKFEDRSLAEKRHKTGSGFEAGSGCGRKQNVQESRKACCRIFQPALRRKQNARNPQSRLQKKAFNDSQRLVTAIFDHGVINMSGRRSEEV
ncbi:hypothetical protein SLEP1_g50246 [Rubroshorea leprosula]|uniref:Uncharacterized protein n=1 Tax=Rubroshorea leprosula TaxID=152421 RepID=A0AAV5M0Q3_9ROSI|nr:hypothetical protein SLEP1_g50246 [Rubroshorea leprosula]